ncbi:MAG TPA: M48 family metalloprotease [Burkholderiaceae bacterium]|nr:M48 family metalloprotease [Burkholderiaceae bacterium]
MTSALRPGSPAARALAALVASVLALAPPAASAQVADNLPRLGDPAGEELSPQAERRLGESIMREIRRDPQWLDDVELVDYLNRFAAPLAAAPAAGGGGFEFFAVDATSINAFALPGGFIGVHTGLLTAAESESELAAVLAHEIGHVTQRHIARMLAQQKQVSLVSMAAIVLSLLAARANPQAAMGGVMLGDQVARSNLLGFSRDAEREADRVGFEILRQAGFDTQAIVSFFVRLQQAARFYESNAPSYVRTHPLTTERIGDMQLRQRESRYRQRADSIEFQMLRARLKALADDTAEGRRNARQIAEQQVRQSPRSTAAWYGLAAIASAQRDWSRADAALAQAQAQLGGTHPYLDSLAARGRLVAGDAAAALERTRAGLARFPDNRALARLHGEALVAAGRAPDAVRHVEEQLLVWRSDPGLWALLGRAQLAAGRVADSHRAVAEQYLLQGSALGAVEQLRLAQRAGTTDFFTASVIDARLRELEPEARRELEETRRAQQR